MTSKADLAKENEKTREVKEREEKVKEGVKDAVHDVKQGVKDLANKTEDMELKDAPDRLLPSAEKIDAKLAKANDSIEEARHSKVGDKELSQYPKVQQVMKDGQRIIQDNRELVKAISEDGTLSDTADHIAGLAQLVKDQTVVSMDKLWTNWASLLTVVAGSSAGNWKQILSESGNILNQLKHTQDFLKILQDLQTIAIGFAQRASKNVPVGQKLEELNAQWEKDSKKLMDDFKGVWDVLNESPLWKQLVIKGKALGGAAKEVGEETKEQVEKSASKVADSAEVAKLKDDFKGILQLIVGKDGPSVQPFLDYCQFAYSDIIENDDFSRIASEMGELFTKSSKDAQSQEALEKDYIEMQKHIKELLDATINNRNLKLAWRESKKLIRAAKKDPVTKKLLEDTAKLVKDVSDKKGLNFMDPNLMGEIRALIVPLMVEHFDNTPLPDYHGHDANGLGKYSYSLSGIRLGATGLVPSKVKVEFKYKMQADPSKLKMEKQRMFMYLEASDIQVAFKDVKWEYHRHTIPRISDKGTIDMATAGKGICLRMKAEMHNFEGPDHAHSFSDLLAEPKEKKMFKVLRAECDIDDFHVRVSEAGGANIFYEMLAGIWGTKIKHQIEHLVEQKMNLLCDKFDSTLYEIVKRATQPTLADQAKDALLTAGKAAGEKAAELAEDAKKTVQSM